MKIKICPKFIPPGTVLFPYIASTLPKICIFLISDEISDENLENFKHISINLSFSKIIVYIHNLDTRKKEA